MQKKRRESLWWLTARSSPLLLKKSSKASRFVSMSLVLQLCPLRKNLSASSFPRAKMERTSQMLVQLNPLPATAFILQQPSCSVKKMPRKTITVPLSCLAKKSLAMFKCKVFLKAPVRRSRELQSPVRPPNSTQKSKVQSHSSLSTVLPAQTSWLKLRRSH